MLALAMGCTGVQQRFPVDVQTAVVHSNMHRLETEHFIIYYPGGRRTEIERFLAHADHCVNILRDSALIHSGAWAEKMILAMPDVAFNNAFVLPELAGYEPVSVIPLHSTLDFTTEFGLPPDPAYIACHELTHYVHLQQVSGLWSWMNKVFGHLYTPQDGYDSWFLEGLATHYEAELQPGVGRPTWPTFTGMFAAAYAHEHLDGGDLSSYGRLASVGHNYLVGAMFVRFLTERSGDAAMWRTIADQAHAVTGWFFAGTFQAGFGVSFRQLLAEFDVWAHKTFPARDRPATQHKLVVVGNDARYARGRDGTEAWIADDVDVPSRLTVRDPRGVTLATVSLVDVLPPRALVQADPLLISGLSITADGNEVWFTVIDVDSTFEITRLVRWRRGERNVHVIVSGLGSGATIDSRGTTYYYCEVDGDRWSLAAYDVASHSHRVIHAMVPGSYVLAAQISADDKRIVADVWDGSQFVAWVLDATTGEKQREIRARDTLPVWDASFTSDGRVMWLGVSAGRFQVTIEGAIVSDAPYSALAPREANGTIRFLDREGWEWELAEIAAPVEPVGAGAPVDRTAQPSGGSADPVVAVPSASVAILSDKPYSPFERLFVPDLRSPTLLFLAANVPHLGFVIGGGDRLGFQRWSLAGYWQPAIGAASTKEHFGGDVSYLNTMLAPWQLVADASIIDWVDPIYSDTSDAKPIPDERRTRGVTLSAVRTFRDQLTVAVEGIYTDDTDAPSGQPSLRRHLGGPSFTLDWVSGESTRYTGLRRALLVSADAGYYPAALSTFEQPLVDVGGSIGAIVPLPFGRRHTLSISVRGRELVTHDQTGLLQLGGDSGYLTLWNRTSSAMTPPKFDDSRFPPNLQFVEPLRGYEDYAITTDRIEATDVSWRYPLIIDRGVAATANKLPASFVSEIDFELFGSGARDSAGSLHAATGFAATLEIQVLRIPMLVTYQIARRLEDDHAITQLFGIAPNI